MSFWPIFQEIIEIIEVLREQLDLKGYNIGALELQRWS